MKSFELPSSSRQLGLHWLFLGALAVLVAASRPGRKDDASPQALAVIVHPENPISDLELYELRLLFLLERQYWPNRERVKLILPPTQSAAKSILLEIVYRKTDEELRKFWTQKLFAGDIPAKPKPARTMDAVVELVRKSEGGVSVVLASDVPEGVRVVTIDGTKPGDRDYPLVGSIP